MKDQYKVVSTKTTSSKNWGTGWDYQIIHKRTGKPVADSNPQFRTKKSALAEGQARLERMIDEATSKGETKLSPEWRR